ncbi:hypothetical protein GCM10027044_27630 [Hymenobacter ruber]
MVADELDGAGANVRDVGPEGVELVGEQFFQAELGGGGEVHSPAKVGHRGLRFGFTQKPPVEFQQPCSGRLYLRSTIAGIIPF